MILDGKRGLTCLDLHSSFASDNKSFASNISNGNSSHRQNCRGNIPQLTVLPNGMTFTLPPGRKDIGFTFNMEIKTAQKIFISTDDYVPMISFDINTYEFRNVSLPIDLTHSLINGHNRILFDTGDFHQPLTIKLLLKEGIDIDELMNQIINERPPPPTIDNDVFASMLCPISKRQIQNPARGVTCHHTQCFDLQTYLERGYQTNEWTCPICGSRINVDDLRYDSSYSAPAYPNNCYPSTYDNTGDIINTTYYSMVSQFYSDDYY